MTRISKSVVSFGTSILAAGVLTLAIPRAAHAVAAALVQVTNTVTTQDAFKQASQLVHLNVEATSDVPIPFNLVTQTNGAIGPYSVPATSSLVITTVDVTPAGSPGVGSTVHLYGASNAMLWAIPGPPSLAQFATVHFSYPSGIVLAPGSLPTVQVESNGSGNQVVIDLFGYLTSN